MISVDWSKLAAAPWYNVAAKGTELVGDKVARLVQYLVSKGLVTLDQVHIAGKPHRLASPSFRCCWKFV